MPTNSQERLTAAIHQASKECTRADGSSYRALFCAAESDIVARLGASHRQVQILALQQEVVPERYARNQKGLSCADQLRLLAAKVAIIGLGGLGGAVTEILARIGIGQLIIVDGDSFTDSNLNRQLLCSVAVLGRKKVEVAAERIQAINPAVAVTPCDAFLEPRNSAEILGGADLAIDCLDSIAARFVLEDACRAAAIPMISAAIAGSSGQAMVIAPGDPGLRRVYGDPARAPHHGLEASVGTLPYTAMVMAAIEAAEAVTAILARPSQLRNALLIADLSELSLTRMEL